VSINVSVNLFVYAYIYLTKKVKKFAISKLNLSPTLASIQYFWFKNSTPWRGDLPAEFGRIATQNIEPFYVGEIRRRQAGRSKSQEVEFESKILNRHQNDTLYFPAANLDISAIKVDDLALSWNLLSTRQALEISFGKKTFGWHTKNKDDLVAFMRSKPGVEKYFFYTIFFKNIFFYILKFGVKKHYFWCNKKLV